MILITTTIQFNTLTIVIVLFSNNNYYVKEVSVVTPTIYLMGE